MQVRRYKITAYDSNYGGRVGVFTWRGDHEAGIAKAKEQAKELGVEKYFSAFDAEEIV